MVNEVTSDARFDVWEPSAFKNALSIVCSEGTALDNITETDDTAPLRPVEADTMPEDSDASVDCNVAPPLTNAVDVDPTSRLRLETALAIPLDIEMSLACRSDTKVDSVEDSELI